MCSKTKFVVGGLSVVVGLFMGVREAAARDSLALWTFETSLPLTSGPHAAEGGVFAASSFASSNSGGTVSNPVGNGSAESFSSNGWEAGEYYQFQTSSTGYEDITISYGQAASSTGPANFDFFYSTDGVSYTQAGGTYAGPTTDFSSGTFNAANVVTWDLSSVSALDNDSSIFFRVAVNGTVSEGGGTISSTGTFRIDDFHVQANAVPEPGSIGLAGLGGLLLLRRRRA